MHERLLPSMVADPLDVSASDASRWDAAPDDERLFWRLVYLFDQQREDAPPVREFARRVLASLVTTGSAETHELLPIIIDQSRLCAVVAKHRQEIISRTGFLSFVAECGYPAHVKLWLLHASVPALVGLCDRLHAERYDAVLETLERPPA